MGEGDNEEWNEGQEQKERCAYVGQQVVLATLVGWGVSDGELECGGRMGRNLWRGGDK